MIIAIRYMLLFFAALLLVFSIAALAVLKQDLDFLLLSGAIMEPTIKYTNIVAVKLVRSKTIKPGDVILFQCSQM